MSKNYIGVPASPGLINAKIFKYWNTEIKISLESQSPEQELAIFNKHLSLTQTKLQKLDQLSKEKMGKEGESTIFAAHIEILKDPEIFKQIKSFIKNNYSAAKAVEKAFDDSYQIFSQMKDLYFKERAIDVLDVKTKLLKSILELPESDLAAINEPVIIVADNLTPSDTIQLNLDFVKGFICEQGGTTSHVAIIARNLKIPAILGLKNLWNIFANTTSDDIVFMNGISGEIFFNLKDDKLKKWNKKVASFESYQKELQLFVNKKTLTKDGHYINLGANIGSVEDLKAAEENGYEGVGLFRTEFLYMNNTSWPSEESQFKNYKEVLQKAKNRPVIIRTLDIGGDKVLSYYPFEEELNPFLGHRAIRWCLEHQDIFRIQLRALLRASVYGNLAIDFPMVATIEELKQAKTILQEEKVKLDKKKISYAKNIQIGIIIEVPATAISGEQFAKHCDFFSVGTNDLIQYTMAADRMNNKLTYLYQPLNLAIINLIKHAVKGAHNNNATIGMCGAAAGYLDAIPIWIGLGFDSLSMSPNRILPARALINSFNKSDAKNLVKQIQQEANTVEDVRKMIKDFKNKFNLKEWKE